MKKKAVKKLVLAKETVRSLEESLLGKAAGGSVYNCEPLPSWDNSCGRICLDEP